MFTHKRNTQHGFTLIELLIVIAVISILAAVAFVSLDPLTRFKDARDSSRWTDISALASAIKIDQVDNRGKYISNLANATATEVFMITSGTTTDGCDHFLCDTNIGTTTSCLNLEGLVDEGYLAALPVSPTGSDSIASTTATTTVTEWTPGYTGYYIQRFTNGNIKVGACQSENDEDSDISVQQ